MSYLKWDLIIEYNIKKSKFEIKIWCSWSWDRSSFSAPKRFPGCCRGLRPFLKQICAFCCRLGPCQSCSWTCLLGYSCLSVSWPRGPIGLDYFECFFISMLLITAFVITAFVSFVVIAFASVAWPAPTGTWQVEPDSLIPFKFMLAAIFFQVPIDFFCFLLPAVIFEGLLAHLVSSGLTSRSRSLDCVATRMLGFGWESATLTVLRHPCPVASSAASSSPGSCGPRTRRACSSKRILRLGLWLTWSLMNGRWFHQLRLARNSPLKLFKN